jgi:hypothetical protein
MFNFQHMNTHEAERLKDLAARVKLALINSGISVVDPSSVTSSGGAKVEIDTGDDDSSGVYVYWALAPSLSTDVSQHLLAGESGHVVVKQSGRIRIAMQEAIIAILDSSGFNAQVTSDDMRPLAVSVSEK